MAGQGVPQSMPPGMNPQQQQILQQQMANLGRQPQQPPQMTGPIPNPPPQMDAMDIPLQLLRNQNLPQNIPPEIKQWGHLKKWVQVNPNLGPNMSEIVWSLQKKHYITLLTNKQQQAQAAAIQATSHGGPGNVPAVAPGMTAPVAPMGQIPMQIQQRMNMPAFQPSQQEIENFRKAGGAKFAAANDDAIRNYLSRSKQSILNQQRQMMINRAAQANAQQHGQSQQNPNNSMGQAMTAQMSQSKPPQPAPEPAQNAQNAIRPPRPQSTSRNPNPNPNPNASSPAQPPKNNLKRASSDDVVEVPNPNAPQSRPIPQQTQGPTQPPQQHRMPTIAQIAAMTPDQRKKFENMVRMNQARQANAAASMSAS
jgi:hypothetical protein